MILHSVCDWNTNTVPTSTQLFVQINAKSKTFFKMPEVWEGKVYKNYESENFDEYMKELGM